MPDEEKKLPDVGVSEANDPHAFYRAHLENLYRGLEELRQTQATQQNRVVPQPPPPPPIRENFRLVGEDKDPQLDRE